MAARRLGRRRRRYGANDVAAIAARRRRRERRRGADAGCGGIGAIVLGGEVRSAAGGEAVLEVVLGIDETDRYRYAEKAIPFALAVLPVSIPIYRSLIAMKLIPYR